MNEADHGSPAQESAASTPRTAQTARRLHEANTQRIEQARKWSDVNQSRSRLTPDPMMDLSERPRRKRCQFCRYRFDYRMHTNRCPECGRYRDDYPHPNHGLAAMVFAGVVVGAVCVLVTVMLVVRGL
ncbi:MAG: hypothetical protein ACNA8P_11985 [Phycisphaerales bacterium]